MIVNCPSCGVKFKLSTAVLGEKGRKVRCSRCGESWHQAPAAAVSAPAPEDSPLAALEAALTSNQEAPESVASEAPVSKSTVLSARPDTMESPKVDPEPRLKIPEEATEEPPSEPAIDKPVPPPFTTSTVMAPAAVEPKVASRMPMIMTALVGLLVVGLALVFGRSWISEQWPAAGNAFEVVGLADPSFGEGLVLRDLTSEILQEDSGPVLVLQGVIVNESDEGQAVPALAARLLDSEGTALEEWIFEPELDGLPAGGQTSFRTELLNPPDQAEINLVFVERRS